jgi:Mn-containing catalase
MILRLDRLQVELPVPKNPSANDAAAVQDLLGGKFGEMSTLMNYTFQSFNFRGRSKLRPYYDLIANIATEEYGHIELVSYAINLLLTGTAKRDKDPVSAPLEAATNVRNTYHYMASGQTALPMDSMGQWWNGSYVFNSGNLKLDLLHNFFLECGARGAKIRAYEMTKDPTARAMVGYLLVRGGVHIVAYAKALQKLTGADVGKLLPIPDIDNSKFPEARVHEEKGLHRKLYRFSPEDYTEAGAIWNGPHPVDGQEVQFEHLPKDFGAKVPDLEPEPQLNAPLDPDLIADIMKKMK